MAFYKLDSVLCNRSYGISDLEVFARYVLSDITLKSVLEKNGRSENEIS